MNLFCMLGIILVARLLAAKMIVSNKISDKKAEYISNMFIFNPFDFIRK